MPGLEFQRIWTHDTVINAIQAEAQVGQELSYQCMNRHMPALVRASERVFGTWGAAVDAAGFDYTSIRRYRKWTRDTIIARIRAWHAKGEDLCWSHVSRTLDPALAAATLHARRFSSWREALIAAGLQPDEIMRYQQWSLDRIRKELAYLIHKGCALDRESLVVIAPALLSAIYRYGDGLVLERLRAELSAILEMEPQPIVKDHEQPGGASATQPDDEDMVAIPQVED